VRIDAYNHDKDVVRLSTATHRQPDILTACDGHGPIGRRNLLGANFDITLFDCIEAELTLVATKTIIKALPLSAASELILDHGERSTTMEWWLECSRRMPKLETLVLHKSTSSDPFFEALTLTKSSELSGDTATPSHHHLQRLRNLSLHGLDLVDPTRYGMLLSGLRYIERASGKLKKLYMHKCRMPNEKLAELQMHVKHAIAWNDDSI